MRGRTSAKTPLALIAAACLLAFTCSSASAGKPRPKPKNPGVCRVAKTGAKCKTQPGKTTTTGTTTTSAPTTTTKKPAPAKPTSPVDKAKTWDGHYSGFMKVTATSGGQTVTTSSPIKFTVIHGVLDLAGGSTYPISNAGQVSLGYGSFRGTLYFTRSASGEVDVHGEMRGTTPGATASAIIEAKRVSA